MLKKLLAGVLSTVVAASAVTALTAAPVKAAQKTQLTFWTLFGGGEGDYMQEIVDNFNKSHPTIQVKNVKLEWAEYYTKLMTAVAAGKGPDIGISHTSKLPELVSQGVVYPMNSYAKAAGIDWNVFNKNILASTIYDGQHYSVPLDTHPFIMYYNKTLLKGAGLLDSKGKPKIGAGEKGFKDFLNTLKVKLPKGVAPFALSNAGDDIYRLWYALYYQSGGKGLVSSDYKSFTMDMTKAVKVADYLKDMFLKDKTIPRNLADFYKTFSTGKAAITMTGGWATPTFETTKGLNFGAMELPNIMGKQVTWGDSHTLILPVTPKEDKAKIKAAMTFCGYVADSAKIWAQAGHIPASDKVVASADFKKLPYRSDFASAASHVVFFNHSTKNWPMIDIIKSNLDTIWNGSKPSKTALTKMVADVNKLLKE